MSESVAAAPGVGKVGPGLHVCALYSGPDERDRVLMPFMQEGLRQGDECVCLVDGLEPADMRRRAYGSAGDVRRGGRLGVYSASDVCSRPGELSVEQVTTLFATTLASSGTDGLPLVRAAAEMSWVQQPGTQDLLHYESAVGEVLAGLPAVFLCLHDLQQLGVGVLMDVLRMHSKVLLDGAVLHNRHCLAPGDFPQPAPEAGALYPLAKLPSVRTDGAGQWLSLTGAEVRVAELVSSGMTNRATAEQLIMSPHTVDAHLKHMYVKLGIHSRVELTVLALQFGGSTA